MQYMLLFSLSFSLHAFRTNFRLRVVRCAGRADLRVETKNPAICRVFRVRLSENGSENRRRYLTSESSLNIGRYMLMMMMPTMTPTPTIIRGSMIEVRAV